MTRNRNNSHIKLANQAPLPIELINNSDGDNDLYNDATNTSNSGSQLINNTQTNTIPFDPRNSLNFNSINNSSANKNGNSSRLRVWATNVYIGDCTIVKGTNNYRYVVWTITIETTTGAKITVYKRYSDFIKLRDLLLHYFPKNKTEIGELPPKRFFQNNLDEAFLRKRRTGLEYFLNSILLNPLFSSSPLVKEFVLKG